MEDFIGAPSEALLAGFTKDQLLRLAGHYKVEISDKDLVCSILVASLVDAGILPQADLSDGAAGTSTVSGGQLTF